MRSLEVVKNQRDALRETLREFETVRDIRGYDNKTKWKEQLTETEKAEHTYVMSCIYGLKNQINALTFVLNEDVDLYDFTEVRGKNRELGITKDGVLKP